MLRRSTGIDLATKNSHKHTHEKKRVEKRLNHMNEEMNIGMYPSKKHVLELLDHLILTSK